MSTPVTTVRPYTKSAIATLTSGHFIVIDHPTEGMKAMTYANLRAQLDSTYADAQAACAASQTSASGSATTATTQASAASASATTATTQASAASASATTATTQASAASASATTATTQASAASASATTATTQATAAAGSATTATTQASAASASATTATTQATAADAARIAAEAAQVLSQEQLVSVNFTAISPGRYVATANVIVTDPASPVTGSSYTVRIAAGSATIGGVRHNRIGAIVFRYFAGSWKTAYLNKNRVPDRIQVANRCVSLTGTLTNSGTETQGQYRIQHKVGASGAKDISLIYGQISNTGTNTTDNTTSLGTLTIKAAIEYNSVIYPLTFRGQRNVTVEPGGFVESDPLGIHIPGGATFYSRQYIICSGGSFARGIITSSTRSEGHELGTSLTDKVDSGTITQQNGVSAYSPLAILGKPLTADHGCVVVLADSLASGVGAGFTTDDKGFVDKAFSGLYGVCNVAVSGQEIVSWNTQGDPRFRRMILERVNPSVIYAGSGGNDLNKLGATSASVQAILTTLWASLANTGAYLVAWTIPPRCTSTDSFATLLNQTVNSPNVNWEAERLALNTWLRAGAGGLVNKVFDFAAICEEGGVSQTGKWKVTGVANGYTSDGAHPNETTQALMVADIDTTMPALVVI